ncbi:hypothetical protein [Helicobacter salomonis]|uniref:hypothetical protein n=1 Tax=Helicobacter salomonis TaxID=56878 RepID=UPI000CF0F79C|nr:hypothetical protein [Helicobacter salomonis]
MDLDASQQLNQEVKAAKKLEHFKTPYKDIFYLFLGRAMFAYLPLVVYMVFNLHSWVDWGNPSFSAYFFLALGYVFIAQINDPFFFLRQHPMGLNRAKVFLLYASKVFLGFCALAIYASKSPIFNNIFIALGFWMASLATLYASVYVDQFKGESKGIQEEAYKEEP